LKAITYQKKIQEAVDFLKDADPKEMIRIISHLDCDGICACAILIKALIRLNRRYSVSIIPQLEERLILQMKKENYNYFIFTDLGSGQMDTINKHLKTKKIIVLDHHQIKGKVDSKNIIHVNPSEHGYDGSSEISGSGVVYQYTKALDVFNKRDAFIAVIGAIGDSQEKKGFTGLNKKILDDAVASGVIDVSKGLRFFGTQTKPLHKVLEYCFDPFIPGVTGSEKGAIKMLNSVGINHKMDNGFKKLYHLSPSEKDKLTKVIIDKRSNEVDPKDIFGNLYILVNENNGPFRDAREYSTLLNACGRLEKSAIGISALLGDNKMKKKAEKILQDYRYEIIDALSWYHKNYDTKNIIVSESYLIINAKYQILPTMVGTIASIISKSKNMKENTIIVSMARTDHKKTKISIRVAGKRRNERLDLREMLSKIIKNSGGEFGGHRNAAGGIINTRDESKFLKFSKIILDRYEIEETV